jgi:hypothetical protein
MAQSVHDLGSRPRLPHRAQARLPLGTLAGHLIGTVNTDNKGQAGIERLLDDTGRVEAVQGREQCRPRLCACPSTSACSTGSPRN